LSSLIIGHQLNRDAHIFKPYTWCPEEAVVRMFVHFSLHAVAFGKTQKCFVSFLTTVSCIIFPM